MKKLSLFLLSLICLVVNIHAVVLELYVGEQYRCEASGLIGSITDKSWTSQGGYVNLEGSYLYRDVTLYQYFSGTATVTFSYKYYLTATSPIQQGTPQTWTFACKDNPITVTPSTMTMTVGGLTRKVGYSLANNDYLSAADIYYESSNPNVAEVDYYTGVVTAKNAGTTNIIVHSKVSKNDNYCAVTVNPAVAPSTISLSKSSLSLEVGISESITCNFTPSNAYSTVTWLSDNTAIATVTRQGTTVNVNAKSVGRCTITATTSNGCTAKCIVDVTPAPSPTSISIGSTTLKVGQRGVIPRYLTPTNSATTLTWESLNPAVATIDESGTATALRVGTATIKATTDNNLSATGVVTVVANPNLPTDLIITPTSMTLEEGKTGRIIYDFLPEGKSDHINWQTSNVLVAIIGANQIVTGIAPGDATITATTDHGLTATCAVHVTAASTPTPTQPTSISLNPSSLSLQVGQSGTITPTFLPAGTTTSVTWQSSNSSIVSVNSSGMVTALKAGSATISATTSNNLSATCLVNVTSATPTPTNPTSISVSPSSVSLKMGETKYVNVVFYPSGTSDKVTWMSMDSQVATVNSSGKITAVSEGEAWIWAKTSNGLMSSCVVTVTKPDYPTGLSLSSSMNLKIGESKYLSCDFIPEDMTDDVTWSSSNTKVVSVSYHADISDMAHLTAKSAGTATITATTAHGVTATCAVTVTMPTQLFEFSYNTQDSTATITKCYDVLITDEILSIPSTIGAYRVVRIGNKAFQNCSNLQQVVIPNGITSIGESAFYYCENLTRLTIPKSVTSIGASAFSSCKRLTTISIPSSVKTIGTSAFANCTSLPIINNIRYADTYLVEAIDKTLSTYSIKAGTRWIGTEAFKNCKSLSTITIPHGVVKIDQFAFEYCDQLNSIYLPHSISRIEQGAFQRCSSLVSIILPDSLTKIGNSAFYGCTSLISVIIPENVTEIGSNAFKGCSSLTTISIGKGVTKIGGWAFNNCNSLTSVHISDIAQWCRIKFDDGFSANPLYFAHHLYMNNKEITDLVIPKGVKTIEDYAFYACISLSTVSIPSTVQSIGKYTFYGCDSLVSVVNHATTPQTDVASDAFSTRNKATLFVPQESISLYKKANVWKLFKDILARTTTETGATIIASGTCGENLTWQLTSDSILTIDGAGEMTVYSSTEHAPWYDYRLKMKSTIIREGVMSIGNYAFYNCRNLLSISIPESITSIGNAAFSLSSGLQAINISSINAWCAISFASSLANPLYYAHKLYLNGKLITNLVIPDSITNIKNYAFYSCSSLKSVTIPNSVTSIGSSAFSSCSALDTIINYAITPQTITSSVFNNVDQTSCTLFVPQESLSAYQNANIWKNFTNIVPLYIPEQGADILASGMCGEQLTWKISRDSILTIKGQGSMTSYSSTKLAPWYEYETQVKSIIVEDGVTSIGNYAFYNCKSFLSISIPSSLAQIGTNAFSGCNKLNAAHISNLEAWCRMDFKSSSSNPLYNAHKLYLNGKLITSLVIPDSITSIKNYAFYSCSSLISISLHDRITSIGNSAFVGCSIKSLPIPNSVINIGQNAFLGCRSLMSIEIPSNTKSIGNGAFMSCDKLQSIVVAQDNEMYSSEEGVLFNKNKNKIIRYPEGKNGTTYTIPSSVDTIIEKAFFDCSKLKSIILPNGIATIESSAFSYCSHLTSITFPNSVTSIGNYAFSGCSALDTIINYAITPQTITSYVFNTLDLTSLTLYVPKESVSAYQNANIWKNFTNILPIPTIIASGTCGENLTWQLTSDSILTIKGTGEMTVYSSKEHAPWYDYLLKIKSVVIREGVTSIGNYAFYNCRNLLSISIPESITSIGNAAFSLSSGLQTINISSINAWCAISFASFVANPLYYAHQLYLNGKLITNLVIPDSITNIKNYAFYSCSSLKSVTIPNSVTSIGSSAFSSCSALDTIINYAITPQTITSSVFNNVDQTSCTLFVPQESLSAYQNANIWKNFANILPKDTIITSGTCGENLTWQLTSDSILTIDGTGEMTVYSSTEHAPWYGYHLKIKSIRIKEGVTSIGNYAFYDCRKLLSISIPESITSIGNAAFLGSIVLRIINISSINAWCAISFASSLANPLYYAHKLYLNGKLITNLVIPDDITSIKHYAFYSCSSLKSVTIPNSVTSLEFYAFSDCSALDTIINYAITPQTITSYVFYNVDQTSCTLFVPQESLSVYQNANIWKNFTNILPINKTTTSIENTSNPQLVENGVLQATSNNPIYIYSVTGQLIRKVMENMNIEELQNGIYILVSPIYKSQRIAIY